jgi:hypothetical protein
MPVNEKQDYLERANQYRNSAADPTGATQTRIQAQDTAGIAVQRLIDMAQAAKNAGVDTKNFSSSAEGYSEEAAKRDALLPPYGQKVSTPGQLLNLGLAAFHGARAGASGQVNPLVDNMVQEVKTLKNALDQTPGLQYTTQEAKDKGINISGGVGPIYGSTQISPAGGDYRTGVKDIDRLFQGANIDDTIAGLKSFQSRINNAYRDTVHTALGDGFRVPINYQDNANALAKGQPIPDPDNKYRAAGKLANLGETPKLGTGQSTASADQGAPSPSPSPSGTPIPQIKTWDVKELDSLGVKPGQTFTGPDGQPYRRK